MLGEPRLGPSAERAGGEGDAGALPEAIQVSGGRKERGVIPCKYTM